MKKLALFATLTIVALLFTSCRKKDYTQFIGTWGVEKIEYYNIDYAGNPIENTWSSFEYDPNSTDNGIQLIFREDKSGEMRDSAIDTIWTNWNEETQHYETFIPCPDTVLVYKFNCSYDNVEQTLYLNMETDSSLHTYRMFIQELNNNTFVYENEYDKNYVEKAYLKRVSKTTSKSGNREAVRHPHHKPGSFFGNR